MKRVSCVECKIEADFTRRSEDLDGAVPAMPFPRLELFSGSESGDQFEEDGESASGADASESSEDPLALLQCEPARLVECALTQLRFQTMFILRVNL